jgi:hypothetical protein
MRLYVKPDATGARVQEIAYELTHLGTGEVIGGTGVPSPEGLFCLAPIPSGAYEATVSRLNHVPKTLGFTCPQYAWCEVDFGALVPGDLNGDNAVDFVDLCLLIQAYGSSVPADGGRYDIDSDGAVTEADADLVEAALGSRSASRLWNPLADINRDGRADYRDLVFLSSSYGAQLGDGNYFAAADCNLDGAVDSLDLDRFVEAYGTHAVSPNWDGRCDVDGDGTVSGVDLTAVQQHLTPLADLYNPACDLNADGHVDSLDLAVLAAAYGASGSSPSHK